MFDTIPNEKGPFQGLIQQLSDVLGTSSGIDSEHVNPNDLLQIMRDYRSDPSEWAPYVKLWSKDGEPYVRNLVDGGNGKYNLLILVWKPALGSRIHDHTKHCCMKVLQGQLQETIFDIPADHDGHEHSLDVKKVSLLHKNEVAYISNSIGIHKMWNTDPNQMAVSLHLYTPPAKICRIFDEQTGESIPWKL